MKLCVCVCYKGIYTNTLCVRAFQSKGNTSACLVFETSWLHGILVINPLNPLQQMSWSAVEGIVMGMQSKIKQSALEYYLYILTIYFYRVQYSEPWSIDLLQRKSWLSIVEVCYRTWERHTFLDRQSECCGSEHCFSVMAQWTNVFYLWTRFNWKKLYYP